MSESLPETCRAGNCEIREQWAGGTLISRRIIHHHGGEPRWDGYDAADLGLGCSHGTPPCPASSLREQP